MQFIEPSAQMGPTARESHPFIGADFRFGQLCVGGVTIHLQSLWLLEPQMGDIVININIVDDAECEDMPRTMPMRDVTPPKAKRIR